MAEITIRKATAQDLPGILETYAQPGIDGVDVIDAEGAEEILRRMDRYPAYAVYVALEDGKVVGSYALLIMDNLRHRGSPSGVVEDVVVHPAWQRRGIGRRMMEHALEACRGAGCYKVTLSSNRRSTAAHAFYASLGFERHGYSFVVDPGAVGSGNAGAK